MQIRKIVEDVYVPEMQNVVIDGVKIEPPQPLPWYPDNLGWQVNTSRHVIKKSPEFSKFHKFIVTENETGNISRQEAVSMVPVLLMNIKPHQWVLDMCAAPGSKTAQIIEAVHANDKLEEMPAGLVVANDNDEKRSYMLIHQLKRMQSPCFVATSHDGQHFPSGMRVARNGDELSPLRFDRVLCDVPCSGDGTMRKNDTIWNTWSHGQALALHKTQVQIFLRGVQLTKVGGRIVYSTCSFNPVENEAVVAEVLRQTKGALELKDVSSELPGLERKPGLVTWKVMRKDGTYIDSVDDLTEEDARLKSIFPPVNAEKLHLERCLRIYPHMQDTGGFFVAVFEKVKPFTREDKLIDDQIKEAKEEQSPASEVGSKEVELPTAVVEQPQPKKQGKADIKPASFELMDSENPESIEIRDFYGLESTFPRDQFLVRSEGKEKSKTIYFISRAVRDLLTSPDMHKLKVVMTGVRLFVRQNSATIEEYSRTPYRLTGEGVPLLKRVMSQRRRVAITRYAELKTLLTEAYPRFDSFGEKTAHQLDTIELGCCVFDFKAPAIGADATDEKDASQDKEHENFNPGLVLPLSIPVWRGRVSVGALLNKQEKKALCQRIFGVVPEETPAHLKERSVANQSSKSASQ
ncbi:S-adenosyl-L-methionine-dependent methyltransferase [Syncephalastrum racemosum]|uniref:S-adenosyl-L-methionine-dependent methyltransferase n=1 Tax=Syncephalastrum racemosum TaxID=13706 RepID=A0A1X2HW50_SYNRA|nr:S-adenosyl-L-methionine-dependent methyltransferase [Syncephalastrum racemosum]